MAAWINPINLIYAYHAYIIIGPKYRLNNHNQSEPESLVFLLLQADFFPNHLHKIIIYYAVIWFMTGARVVNSVATILMTRPASDKCFYLVSDSLHVSV